MKDSVDLVNDLQYPGRGDSLLLRVWMRETVGNEGKRYSPAKGL